MSKTWGLSFFDKDSGGGAGVDTILGQSLLGPAYHRPGDRPQRPGTDLLQRLRPRSIVQIGNVPELGSLALRPHLHRNKNHREIISSIQRYRCRNAFNAPGGLLLRRLNYRVRQEEDSNVRAAV